MKKGADKRENKKGITVQSMLIGIIIIVLAAAIIFFFLKSLPYKETVDKEACHQSVILRNNAFLKGEFGIEIPLNCKTQEIIISSSNEEFIKREIANAMYDCWWMLGEGKMNFFKQDPHLKKDSYCIVCSIIKFDKDVQNKILEIKNFNNYLEDTKIPQKNITYWQYFTSAKVPTILKGENDNPNIDTSRDYAIIYSLTEKSTLLNVVVGGVGGWGLAKTGAAIGTFIAPGVGTLVGGIIGLVAGAAAGYIAGDKLTNIITNNPEGYWVAFMILPFEAEALKKFGCQNIESIP